MILHNLLVVTLTFDPMTSNLNGSSRYREIRCIHKSYEIRMLQLKKQFHFLAKVDICEMVKVDHCILYSYADWHAAGGTSLYLLPSLMTTADLYILSRLQG